MHWIEVFIYVFISVVIILITRGALKAFHSFYHGEHHE